MYPTVMKIVKEYKVYTMNCLICHFAEESLAILDSLRVSHSMSVVENLLNGAPASHADEHFLASSVHGQVPEGEKRNSSAGVDPRANKREQGFNRSL